MNIAILYGATFSDGWGRSQNLAMALARLGHHVLYLDCIRPAFRPAPRPAKDIPGIEWHRAAPGLPESAGLSGLHAVWQAARLFALPNRRIDLAVFYGVPHPLVQRTALRRLGPSRAIYDCADDKVSTFRDLSGIRASRKVERWEHELVSRVDAITAINESNLDRLDPTRTKSRQVVPNGVDLDIFRFRERTIPRDRPLRLAYAGTVNDRLDVARIHRILESNPDCEIHMIGGDHPALDPVRRHPRLKIRGRVGYRELPALLDECDIGLVPYLDLPSIRASSPLKSLQYLAMGLPVLAFEYPGIPTLGGAVRILDGDVLPAAIRSWKVDDPTMVHGHSWEASARQLVEASSR